MGKKVAIIFGGQSSEHEVSCISACTVIKNMEYEKVITSSRVEDRYRYFLEIYPDLVEKVSKKDIASYLNMTPESLSRLLKNIEKEAKTN